MAQVRPGIGRLLSGWNCLVFAAWLVVPYLAFGSHRWALGWAYDALLLAGVVTAQIYVGLKNPALRERRRSLGANTKAWDLCWNALFWPLMAAVPIAAGFGARLAVPPLPGWTWPLGATLLASGLSLSAWAMSVNPHFEGTVRIQEDQLVVDAGPYRFVRHPGYLALVLWSLATPLLLLSILAVPFAALVCAWVGLRAALEDRLLRAELPGYAEYAGRVRARLLPRIW